MNYFLLAGIALMVTAAVLWFGPSIAGAASALAKRSKTKGQQPQPTRTKQQNQIAAEMQRVSNNRRQFQRAINAVELLQELQLNDLAQKVIDEATPLIVKNATAKTGDKTKPPTDDDEPSTLPMKS